MAYEKAEEQYTQCGKACKEYYYPEERKEQDNLIKLKEYEKQKKSNS